MDGVNLNPIIDKSTEVIPLEKEAKAAVKIQAAVRGFFARQGYLPRKISYKEYSPLVNRVEGMKKAQSGKTAVFFPHQLEQIILKKSGKNEAVTRFHQMQAVRAILKMQKATHLVIPRAALCGEFLVETRLPVDSSESHNMWLYTSEPQLFDEAVREFVRLSREVSFTDLVSSQPHPRNNIVGDTVRYDNLPLFIEEVNGVRTGKLGFIDLEHTSLLSSQLEVFEKMSQSEQKEILEDNGVESIEELVEIINTNNLLMIARIFPYQKEIIKQEAGIVSEEVIERIDENAMKGEKFLEKGFENHSNWLKAKDVSVNSNGIPLIFSNEGKIALRKGVMLGLIEFERRNFGVFNGELSDVADQLTPIILEELEKFIEAWQSFCLGRKGNKERSWADLVELRSVVFERSELRSFLKPNKISPFVTIKNENKLQELSATLADRAISELVKAGEFYCYDNGICVHGVNRENYGWFCF